MIDDRPVALCLLLGLKLLPFSDSSKFFAQLARKVFKEDKDARIVLDHKLFESYCDKPVAKLITCYTVIV